MKVHSISSIVRVVRDECGEGAALAMLAAYGGQRIDIPKKPSGRLAETLGEDVARVLVEHFSGCRIDMPSRGHSERIASSLRLRKDILNADQTGLSLNEIAVKHGVTHVWVRKLRRDLCGDTFTDQTRKS